MNSVLIHVAIYLVFAVLFSLLVSLAIAMVSRRFDATSESSRPSEGLGARTALGFGGWFSCALLFLAVMLSPEATGLRLYGVVASATAATAFAFGWKRTLRPLLTRLDQLAEAGAFKASAT